MALRKIIFTVYVLLFVCTFNQPLTYAGNTEILDLSSVNDATRQIKAVSPGRIISTIQALNQKNDFSGLRSLAGNLIDSLPSYSRDSSMLAEICYCIGVCMTIVHDYDAIFWLQKTIDLKEKLKQTDIHYTNSVFNQGVVYNYFGDFAMAIKCMQNFIGIASELYGENSGEVAQGYSTLIGAILENRDYDKFPGYAYIALGIISRNKSALTDTELGDLYHNIGIGYLHTGDYAKARIFLEEAESLMNVHQESDMEDYINLINSLAIAFDNLNLPEKEMEYFEKGLRLASAGDSYLSFNLINTYVSKLVESGNASRGEHLLKRLVEKSQTLYGVDSRYYIESLKNYAEFLMKSRRDYKTAESLFSECMDFVNKHPEVKNLRGLVIAGYTEALFRNGNPGKALDEIQKILFKNGDTRITEPLVNPAPYELQADKKTLKILRLKYEILQSLFSENSDVRTLVAAASTTDLMISLIDKIRMNISEEESRILLGDRYRSSYLQAIRDFELCYRLTGDNYFLDKAFEFAERSKVAGLLAATRELNAIQFRVPEEAASLENSLQKEISSYNYLISAEKEKSQPDEKLLSDLNNSLFSAIKARDSLVITFERDFPDYYLIKYSNTVPSPAEIPSVIGKNNNYLNYIVSDTLLYIFIANRKHHQAVISVVDSVFFSDIRRFRSLLSDQNASTGARKKFSDFHIIGNKLYRKLIEPVTKYLVSGNIIISPDNILSYVPFETLAATEYSGEEIAYRELDYLMNHYNISYAYSATYLSEMSNRNRRGAKNLIAFAPNYQKELYTDSLFMKRQSGIGVLYDLQYARQEAEFVAGITGGIPFLNNNAKESVFKAEAGKYDIIHLAMHTILNDQNPMNSAMLFALSDDPPEDGMLFTYEVYGVPLRARMVVLSSCNTGYGKLASGEGILSLARGFMYSGSKSVIMSMWDVEDKAGTDIIELFYRYLKKGKSKSEALRKARELYLSGASQMKSHPYFWSTLVIYGDNSRLFFPRKAVIGGAGALTAVFVVVLVTVYLRKRRYS